MGNVWEKFDKNIDMEALREDVANAAESNAEFEEIPLGSYEVKVYKMEFKESKSGKPMLCIWLKILSGKYEGLFIFYNQALHTGFGIHKVNEFLRNLESGIVVYFENFEQYNNLILDIHEAIYGNLEYCLEYGENQKGYKTYKIIDVFES